MSNAAAAVRVDRPEPRILIVDDSAVARAAMSRIVTESGRFTLVAALSDTRRALELLRREHVDIILLDLVMPHTSGIDALPDIIATARAAKVLIVSSSAAEGAAVTMQALALGAADTLVKPAAGVAVGQFGATLLQRLDLLAAPAMDAPRPQRAVQALPPFDAIAVGASTGGIHALASLLGAIPNPVRQPIVVTQHLPGAFSSYFAAQLAVSAGRPCIIAEDRSLLAAGRILVAPGDAHLVACARRDGQVDVRLSALQAPTGNLPSVDPMLQSLAAIYGPRLLAVVLSGMGRDGLIGAQAVHDAGGTVIVQDRASSVVWGMPGAVARARLATAVASPAELGELIGASA